jgi:HlyD family secretion protein
MTNLLPKPQNKVESLTRPEVKQPLAPPPKHKPKKRLLLLAGIAIAAVAAPTWYFLSRPQSSNTIELSGRIEGYETDIGAKVPGRIDFVAVREGDRVREGQLIVKLDDSELQAQLQGANARLEAAQEQAEQARLQIGTIEAQIQEAQLNLQQARGETQGRVSQAEAELSAAQAQLTQAQAQLRQSQAQLKLARTDRDRYVQLAQQGAVTQQQADQAQTALDTAQATVEAGQAQVETARRQVNAARGALTQAQTTSLKPDVSIARINALKSQLAASRRQFAAAQADTKNAQATRQQILAQMAYLNVTSPINGTVTARSVEPGTVVASGKTLLTVINPNTVYLRGFIPEGEIGKVRVGQKAEIYLDSAPDRPLSGHVSAIDTEASFTPENIYFKEDRVEQVFGVKIAIDQPGGLAKPGMPADAAIVFEQENNNAVRK